MKKLLTLFVLCLALWACQGPMSPGGHPILTALWKGSVRDGAEVMIHFTIRNDGDGTATRMTCSLKLLGGNSFTASTRVFPLILPAGQESQVAEIIVPAHYFELTRWVELTAYCTEAPDGNVTTVSVWR